MRVPGPETPDFRKPENLYTSQFSSYRWRKYLRRLAERSNERHRLAYGRWLCRGWPVEPVPEAIGAEALERFYLYYIHETTPLPGAEPKLRIQMVWRHFCHAGAQARPDEPLEQAIEREIGTFRR